MPTRLRYPLASWIILIAACGYTLTHIADLYVRQTIGVIALASMIVLVPWTVISAYRVGRQIGLRHGEVVGAKKALRHIYTQAMADEAHPPVNRRRRVTGELLPASGGAAHRARPH